jgi:hypothetical protein
MEKSFANFSCHIGAAGVVKPKTPMLKLPFSMISKLGNLGLVFLVGSTFPASIGKLAVF